MKSFGIDTVRYYVKPDPDPIGHQYRVSGAETLIRLQILNSMVSHLEVLIVLHARSIFDIMKNITTRRRAG